MNLTALSPAPRFASEYHFDINDTIEFNCEKTHENGMLIRLQDEVMTALADIVDIRVKIQNPKQPAGRVDNPMIQSITDFGYGIVNHTGKLSFVILDVFDAPFKKILREKFKAEGGTNLDFKHEEKGVKQKELNFLFRHDLVNRFDLEQQAMGDIKLVSE